MKTLDSSAIAALCFSLFMIAVAAISFTLDGYKTYQKHQSFQTAYESSMNCRASLGTTKDFKSHEYVDEVCKQVPKWEDYK